MLQSVHLTPGIKSMPDWASWTVDEAAEKTGYSEEYIRWLIRKKKVAAVKFGTLWLIRQDSLKKYLDEAKSSNDPRTGPQRKWSRGK